MLLKSSQAILESKNDISSILLEFSRGVPLTFQFKALTTLLF